MGLIGRSIADDVLGAQVAHDFAGETGGRAFFPNSISELPEIAGEIVRDLRTQYVVSYAPTNKAHDGTYRSIKVGIADSPGQGKRIALTRSGRTAGQGAAAKPAPKTSTPANNNARQPATSPRRKSPKQAGLNRGSDGHGMLFPR